jgi:tight adherence protein B
MDLTSPSSTMMLTVIFGAYAFIGGLAYAFIMSRKGHTEELSRLDKHRKRMEEREAAKIHVNEDIFLKERNDFLGKMLAQAGLESQYDKMRSYWIGAAVGTPILLGAITAIFVPVLMPVAIFFGPGIGAFAFIGYIKHLITGRQRRMTAQLPAVLESMVSSLKAGSPVVECFKLLSETAPDPIRSEFKRSLVSLQLGKPFRDVMREMCDRIRTPDFKLLTQAIYISQDVGANLADVVAVIAEAIRERFRLRDFMAALTAQGKATAVFIGCLPYFITFMTYLMAPGYMTPFLNHPVARIVFIGMIIWEGIGFWVLMKLCTFEV